MINSGFHWESEVSCIGWFSDLNIYLVGGSVGGIAGGGVVGSDIELFLVRNFHFIPHF